jgi:hypothetical protein
VAVTFAHGACVCCRGVTDAYALRSVATSPSVGNPGVITIDGTAVNVMRGEGDSEQLLITGTST